jgi:hypothetical protein
MHIRLVFARRHRVIALAPESILISAGYSLITFSTIEASSDTWLFFVTIFFELGLRPQTPAEKYVQISWRFNESLGIGFFNEPSP